MMQAEIAAGLVLLTAVSVAACRVDAPDTAPSAGAAAATSGADSGAASAAIGGEGGNVSKDAGPSQTAALTFDTIMQTYSDWTRATAGPQPISVEIFSLCRAPSDAEQRFVESEHGKNLYLQDWLNPAAVRGQEAKGKSPFAPGAAIVKQKLAMDANGKLAVVALGLMIKRDRGFDAAHGDWEFGYWEPQPGLKDGPAEASHCGGCHASSPTDYVFLDQSWRLAP